MPQEQVLCRVFKMSNKDSADMPLLLVFECLLYPPPPPPSQPDSMYGRSLAAAPAKKSLSTLVSQSVSHIIPRKNIKRSAASYSRAATFVDSSCPYLGGEAWRRGNFWLLSLTKEYFRLSLSLSLSLSSDPRDDLWGVSQTTKERKRD
jgi:hypothetical protein